MSKSISNPVLSQFYDIIYTIIKIQMNMFFVSYNSFYCSLSISLLLFSAYCLCCSCCCLLAYNGFINDEMERNKMKNKKLLQPKNLILSHYILLINITEKWKFLIKLLVFHICICIHYGCTLYILLHTSSI